MKKEKRKNTPFFIPVFFLFPGKSLERDGEEIFLPTRPFPLHSFLLPSLSRPNPTDPTLHRSRYKNVQYLMMRFPFFYYLFSTMVKFSSFTLNEEQTDRWKEKTLSPLSTIQIHHFCIYCCKDRSQSDLGKTLVNILFAPPPFVFRYSFCKTRFVKYIYVRFRCVKVSPPPPHEPFVEGKVNLGFCYSFILLDVKKKKRLRFSLNNL